MKQSLSTIRTAETFLHILKTSGKERFIACLRRGVVEELARRYVEEVLGEDFESYLRAETERRYMKAVTDLEAKIKLLKEKSL